MSGRGFECESVTLERVDESIKHAKQYCKVNGSIDSVEHFAKYLFTQYCNDKNTSFVYLKNSDLLIQESTLTKNFLIAQLDEEYASNKHVYCKGMRVIDYIKACISKKELESFENSHQKVVHRHLGNYRQINSQLLTADEIAQISSYVSILKNYLHEEFCHCTEKEYVNYLDELNDNIASLREFTEYMSEDPTVDAVTKKLESELKKLELIKNSAISIHNLKYKDDNPVFDLYKKVQQSPYNKKLTFEKYVEQCEFHNLSADDINNYISNMKYKMAFDVAAKQLSHH